MIWWPCSVKFGDVLTAKFVKEFISKDFHFSASRSSSIWVDLECFDRRKVLFIIFLRRQEGLEVLIRAPQFDEMEKFFKALQQEFSLAMLSIGLQYG